MLDRVPTYPGRVRLTPVTGQTNVYDMTRQDAATQIGTPLNKATLLTDATAALLGLSGNPTVNDALAALANGKANIFVGNYTGNGTYGSANKNTLTFDFAPKVVMIVARTKSTGTFYGSALPWINGDTNGVATVGVADGYYRTVHLSWSGKTVSWYHESFAIDQLNMASETYYYVAIG